MSKDYKHCIQQAQKQNQKPAVAGWQWLLAGALVVGFAVFLLSLRGKTPQAPAPQPAAVAVQPQKPAETAKKAAPAQTQAETQPLKEQAVPKETPSAAAEKPKPPKPRFQFYTVLPEKEVIIPEAEVKARKQEEKQGKAPPAGDMYVLQIGSFKTFGEADRLKAQLAMLGVEAKIEVAQIGSATWNRVKVGPFVSIASADKIRHQLRQSNIDSVVQKTAGAPLQALPATQNVPATPP